MFNVEEKTKYEPIRASNFDMSMTITAEAIGTIETGTQLDKLEKKVDRILELLENGESSTLEIGKLEDLPDDVLNQFNLRKKS